MVSDTIDVGSTGKWRIVVTYISGSADNAANTSKIDVNLDMYNGGTSTAFNNDGATMKIQSGSFTDYSATVPFSVPAGSWKTVVSKQYTITHGSDGKKTVSVSGYLGNSGTNTFGSGGTAGPVSLVLPNLAQAPNAPSPPKVVSGTLTDTTVRLTFVDSSDDGGINTSDWRIYLNTTNTTSGATSYVPGSDRTMDFSGLAPKTTYYAWSRSYNTEGWSPYSTVTSFKTFAVPDAPSAPAITNIRQTSFAYSFTDGANNGASITARELWWAMTPTGTKTKFTDAVDNSDTIDTISKDPATGPQGKKMYIFARTFNEHGWSAYSAYTEITILAGAYVKVAGVWKEAVPYVKVAGVWRLAEPWVKVNGVWKQTTR